MRRDLGVNATRGETNTRAGMIQNVSKLGAMQFGIGRHRGEASVPDTVEQRDIVR